jgi:branched-chain amino acid transport system substrate-binding protein
MNCTGKFAGVLCVLASTTMLAPAAVAEEPINVGAVLSITGPGAGIGVPERNGVLLAQKVINAKGGIGGRQLNITVEDDASNPDVAITKANDLIYTKKVVALIGATQTAPTVAVGGLTSKMEMAQISFSGIGPDIEKSRKCVFHILPPQVLNAKAMLAYAKHIGAKKIGVLYDAGYGNVVMQAINGIYKDYGVELTALEKFEIGATDTTTQTAKVRASNPDAIFIIATNGAPFRNVKQLRVNKPVIAAIGTASYEYVTAMGVGADNVVHPEFVVGEDPLPHQKDFVALYHKEYGRLPKNFEAAGWDAVFALKAGLEKAKDASPGKICEAMQAPYHGVMADYDFSADDMTGIKLGSFTYSILKDGAFSRLPFKIKE